MIECCKESYKEAISADGLTSISVTTGNSSTLVWFRNEFPVACVIYWKEESPMYMINL